MSNFKDRTGVKYHHLVAIQRLGLEPRSQKILWLWRCDCGKEFEGIYYANKRSCGCHPPAPRPYKDYANKRIGLLTIQSTFIKNKKRHWFALCDCGNTYTISHSHLISTPPKSCGCLTAQLIRKNGIKLTAMEKKIVKKQQIRKQFYLQTRKYDSGFKSTNYYNYLKLVK